MAEYTPPTEAEASIIAAAEILAGDEAEYDHPSDRRAVFSTSLRQVAASVRNIRNRRAVESIIGEDTAAFASVIRGVDLHEKSQRYEVQLEDPDNAEIEYISTARADNDVVAVEQLVGEIDEATDHLCLVYKHKEEGKDGRTYRSLVHFQIIGGTRESEHDDLAEQLREWIAQRGNGKKKKS